VPFQTAVPTATPAPSQAPGPAITPNKRYEKVQFGDKGTNVKKLQNRLIELGFMPKGSADGQYGYQTYNAVKDFQRANYLEVDGVAGPMTLTYLYENPDIITPAGPTSVPTATPTPTLPPLDLFNDQ
jgi:peptidoglycan hydrolase-like protein with peptidoglycan-binding domain